jgi:hypothetical protein
MATTGTTNFDLDFTEIAEEAWQRAGREMKSGYDLKMARRSMNLMLIEWQNRGINMWTVDEGTLPLVSGTDTYTLPADTIDLLEAIVRTGSGSSQNDIAATRISVSTYSAIPNKNSTGRPLQYYINRLRDAPTVTVWPVPSNNDYTFQYWRMRRMEDAGSGVETPDVVFRFYPVLVAGLAYHLAMKDANLADRIELLKQVYDEQFNMAASEDREKASWFLTPKLNRW